MAMFSLLDKKPQRVIVNRDGSVRVNLENKEVRAKILEQVKVARQIAQNERHTQQEIK